MAEAAPATKTKTKKRIRSTPRYRSFRLHKKRLSQPKKLPSIVWLLKSALQVIFSNKKLFLGLTAIYAVVSFVFVQGIGSTFQISEIKDSLNELFGNSTSDRASVGLALFGYLIGSAGTSAGEASGVYQMLMVLIFSLATIWGVRQIQAGKKPSAKDTLYGGMYPLIPFMAVIFIICLQLIPLVAGNLIYSTVLQNGLAVSFLEKALWLLVFLSLALLSVYMVASSIFSLYIVTLPDMKPLKALRSARELVLHRRFAIILRLIALPLIFALLSAILFIPLLFIVPQIVEFLFLFAVSFGLIFSHVYVYLLYRELI